MLSHITLHIIYDISMHFVCVFLYAMWQGTRGEINGVNGQIWDGRFGTLNEGEGYSYIQGRYVLSRKLLPNYFKVIRQRSK